MDKGDMLTHNLKRFDSRRCELGSLPFEFVVGPGRERWRLENFAHFFATEAEVVYRPHVAELHHFHLQT